MAIYLNRVNIQRINELRRVWGNDCFSQTNSKRNGRLAVVRLYMDPEDKGRTGAAFVKIETPKQLKEWHKDLTYINSLSLEFEV